MGRTGIQGRGILNRYGPNHLCTAIITRLFCSYMHHMFQVLLKALCFRIIFQLTILCCREICCNDANETIFQL